MAFLPNAGDPALFELRLENVIVFSCLEQLVQVLTIFKVGLVVMGLVIEIVSFSFLCLMPIEIEGVIIKKRVITVR